MYIKRRYSNKSTPAVNRVQNADKSFKLYPNGEFTIGFIPPKKVSDKERAYDDSLGYTEIIGDVKYDGDTLVFPEKAVIHNRFINSPSLSQPRQRMGSAGLPSGAGRKIRNLCFLLEQRGTPLGFYTLTLPALDSSSMELVQRSWGDIQRRFFERLSRKYLAVTKGSKLDYVWVCESQTRRSETTGFYCPHIHFVMPCKFGNSFWMTADELRQIWREVLTNRLKIAIDTSASVDAQVVRKSASAYISKYLSKCRSKSANDICDEDSLPWHPSRYWGCSDTLRDELSSAVIKSGLFLSDMLLDICRSRKDLLAYRKEITYKSNDTVVICGYCGCLNEQGMSAIFSGLQ